MFSLFFHEGAVSNFEDACKADRQQFTRFFGRMIEEGVYIAPSPFEAWFVSTAHTDEDVDKTLDAVRKSLGK